MTCDGNNSDGLQWWKVFFIRLELSSIHATHAMHIIIDDKYRKVPSERPPTHPSLLESYIGGQKINLCIHRWYGVCDQFIDLEHNQFLCPRAVRVY